VDDDFSHLSLTDPEQPRGLSSSSMKEIEEVVRTGTLLGADGSNGSSQQSGKLPTWNRLYTLADAFAEREPVEYVIEGLFPIPSLSILYGLPGDFKSMLLMDAAVCVASGTPWLPPLKSKTVIPRKTHQKPVFWYDYDNGKRRCDERFQALAKTRGISATSDLPFYYLSVPSRGLDFHNEDNIAELLEPKIEEHKIQFLCIDNLATISGNVDENSVEMSTVMSNLRKLVEKAHLACVVIHHQRKSKEKELHAGESLRGHSSINAAIDLALKVDRKPGTDTVTVRSTKTRGQDVQPFGAEFRHTPRPDKELETAQFFGLHAAGADTNDAVQAAIIKLLEAESSLNQSTITKLLVDEGFKKRSIHLALEMMVRDRALTTCRGRHNAKFYQLA